jgi:hypothetical protein
MRITRTFGVLGLFALLAISFVGTDVGAVDPPVPSTAPTTNPMLPANVRLKLFLLIGQSNMSGRGIVEPQDQVADLRVWMFRKSGAWTPAVDPLHQDKSKIAGVGMGRTFAFTVADAEPGTTIGLIPCAVGGTLIERWVPTGDLYVAALKQTKLAMQHGELVGILWHQGEANSTTAERMAGYEDALASMIAGLRKDLDAPNIPIVVGQIGPFLAKKRPLSVDFNRRIVAFATTQPHMACVTSEGLTSIGDEVHFDAKSQRELGRRYAVAYLKLCADASASPQR